MSSYVRTAIAALMILGASLAPATLAAKTAREVAAERFARAQGLLEDLQAVPKLELGVRQYDLVVDAFRAVHRASPSSGYCDDALLAAADLLAEMVDRFGEERRGDAIEAYRFLIREYPHSKLLGEARDAIARLERGDVQPAPKRPAATEDDEAPAPPAPVEVTQADPAPPRTPVPAPASRPEVRNVSTTQAATAVRYENRAQTAPARTKTTLALVENVRYWEHPDALRVVVDLDDYVPYKFDFLSNPSRMYFDLLAARLDGEVIRGLEQTLSQGPVKTIRVAQNRRNKARIVLDLSEEVLYDISWLTGPPRLVIGLRSKSAPPTEPLEITRAAPAPPPVEPPARTPEPAQVTAQETVVTERRVVGEPATFEEALRQAQTQGRVIERTTTVATESVEERQAPAAEPAPPPVRAELPARAVEQPVRAAAAAPATPAPELAAVSQPVSQEAMGRFAPPPSPEPAPVIEATLAPPKPADATSLGSRSLVRALGLKVGRIVIDAGHGGHDTGSIGPSGLREKDLVLDVSLRLGKLIQERLGAEVVYTRQDDRFINLYERPKIANRAQADLFVSVHANSARQRSPRGVETYYLSFTKDSWAMEVASRENAASDRTVHELQDLLSKIALNDKIDESREFAGRVHGALYGGLSESTEGLRDRGVRKAPLVVLIGAQMPAVLAEIGFLSNPTDEKLMKSSKYREQIAEHLYSGIEGYVRTLSAHQLTMTPPDGAAASMD